MEAIIRTENKSLFEAILQFLKKLQVSIEIREGKTMKEKKGKAKKYPLAGTVIKYSNPFDSATNISDWEAHQ